MTQKSELTILIAPLDWGLGHATRCIPIIQHLLQSRCKVIIAAEGLQEKLLKTEFPLATFVHLPGYRISYANSKRWFALKIAWQLPKIIFSIKKERRWLLQMAKQSKIDAIISDNRYGLHHPEIPSIIITHQLKIKAPVNFVEKILQKINYKLLEKFTTCWVPDEQGDINLAGELSHPRTLPKMSLEYLGGLSRLEKQGEVTKEYDVLIVLSGPEPQRTLLETKILEAAKSFIGKILLLRGLPQNEARLDVQGNVVVKNHLPAKELQQAFAESEYIISRSGYTTVMDICKLKKKSILIPTPGQTEQEYLAKHLEQQGWCMAVEQHHFSLHASIEKAKKFHFTLPSLRMEDYKKVLTDFLLKL